MSTIAVNAITDASGGNTANINGYTPTVSNMAGRNLIINGAMQVWQRGTSQTVSGDYAADRFWMANAASASRSTDAPSGFTYSTKLTYSASTMSIGQPIELPATGNSAPMVAGETVTLSFYAKVDSGTEDFNVAINFRDAKFSGTNQASFAAIGGSVLTATTSWQRFEKTFTIPAVNGTNVLAGLEIRNIDRDFYITGVQLEAGSVATPFEHRQYGQELALCQRYYEILSSPGGDIFLYNIEADNAGGFRRGISYYKVEKRAAPSVVLTWVGTPGTARGVQLNETYGVGPYVNGIGSSSYAALYKIEASAEL